MSAAVRDNAERHRFELELDGGTAYATYRRDGDVVVIPHTEVPAALNGHGYGSQLVRGALDLIRARGLKVRPLCPFVAAFIRRHAEYRDLVA